MVVLSCDHSISPREGLIALLDAGCHVASDKDCLITIGISPNRAETGYGYIEQASLYDRYGNVSIFHISKFTEKPDRVTAQRYYYDRRHLWNSGMFIWSTRSILRAMRKHQPDMADLLDEYSKKIGTPDEWEARKQLYLNCEKVSIDIAILEKAENVLVIKGDIMWDDVGSWRALERLKVPDPDNNIICGDVIAVESYESTMYNNTDGVIATLGVSDLVIVRSDNITLVTHRTRADEIGKILEKLRDDEEHEKYL
jgi:mannose-1-phosphate guanylyltransferase